MVLVMGIALVAACWAGAAEVKEGVVEVPKPPRTDGLGLMAWSPQGDAALVRQHGEYLDKRTLLGGRQGYLLSAWFVLDAKTGKVASLCRAHDCAWMPDGRLLARGYAPFDAQDIETLSFGAGPQGNRAVSTLLERDGRVAATLATQGVDCAPSPDAKRFLITQEPAGRNNYGCLRKLVVETLGGQAKTLPLPIEERPGRLVGYRYGGRWLGPDRFRISLVDMDAKEAARAMPGMWLGVEPQWFDYVFANGAKGAWEKLAGEALDDARAEHYPLPAGEGEAPAEPSGEVLVRPGRIDVLKAGRRSTLLWPEAKDLEITVRAASADGTRLFVSLKENEVGLPGGGRDGGPGASPGAPGGAAPPQAKPQVGYYALNVPKSTKVRLSLEPRAIWNSSFSVCCYLEDGALLIIPDDGPAATADEATGKLSSLAVPGFPWPKFIITRWAGPARDCTGRGQPMGSGRVGVLARQARFVQTPHAIAVFRGKEAAGCLAIPEGFPLGDRSYLHWSPDGSALAVTSQDGTRVWLTRAMPKTAF